LLGKAQARTQSPRRGIVRVVNGAAIISARRGNDRLHECGAHPETAVRCGHVEQQGKRRRLLEYENDCVITASDNGAQRRRAL
jgi:hypothetical protein